jgi:YD repeat-containing protein
MQGSTERTVTTYSYDPLGRLTEVRSTRPSDGWTLASTYEYGARCSGIHRGFEEPPGVVDSIDPVEQALDRFLARP